MGAPVGSKNALGNKGGSGAPIAIDRSLAKEVRRLTLGKIKAILEQPIVKMQADDYELYKALLIKLAGSVLPRLQEISGPEGELFKMNIVRCDREKEIKQEKEKDKKLEQEKEKEKEEERPK